MEAIKLRIQEVCGFLSEHISAVAAKVIVVSKVFGPNWELLSLEEVAKLMEEPKLKATEGQLFSALVKWCRWSTLLPLNMS